MTEVLPWPAALSGTPAVAVIERAIERSRLANSLLLHGENLGTLATVAHAIADRLLNDPRNPSQYFPPKEHPDYFPLRPAKKMRMIRVGESSSDPGTMREFISRIQKSPQISFRKVAIVYEADRMNTEAANAFLKTLEEPPASTTILLLTTRPYSLLPTIRSRCLHFRFTDAGSEALAGADEATRGQWKSTLADYAAWLGAVALGATDKRAVADQVLGVYGLITRFNAVLAAATDQAWKQQKEKLPDELDDDEVEAIQVGLANGIRLKLFSELENATRDFAQKRLLEGDESARRALVAAIAQLEHDIGLLRLNLNEAAALENFLLGSLRLWTRR
ncbi:MAG: DNA polymerase III subunit gamma/tau [Opitutaceae bacterium]|jgi:DNA polymerase-3 subunit delta'|nr:DNA polymerase III subunit gamma/tau [Opitutaceae bacterium]